MPFADDAIGCVIVGNFEFCIYSLANYHNVNITAAADDDDILYTVRLETSQLNFSYFKNARIWCTNMSRAVRAHRKHIQKLNEKL